MEIGGIISLTADAICMSRQHHARRACNLLKKLDYNKEERLMLLGDSHRENIMLYRASLKPIFKRLGIRSLARICLALNGGNLGGESRSGDF